MLYTAAPSTWPTGSNPVLLIAANSSAVSADPQVPLRRISAIRASAAGGRPLPGSTVTLRPLVALFTARLTIQDGPGPAALAVAPGIARLAWPPVLGVPLLIATPDRLQSVRGRLAGRIGTEPVLARTAGPLLHLVVSQAEPPALVIVHVTYNSRSCLLPSSPAGYPRSAPSPRISPGLSTWGGAPRESASLR